MSIITQQLTKFYKDKKGYKGAVLEACVNKDLKSAKQQSNLSEHSFLECHLDEVMSWNNTKEGWNYWNERNSYLNELIGEEKENDSDN